MDVQLTRDRADAPFFGVVEAQDLRLDVRRCHHGPVLSNRVAQRLDDEPGDAEIPSGRDPNIAGRTNDSAGPAATIGQSRLSRRSQSPASRTPEDHPPSAGVNPDASLSCRAPGSDAPAQHGRSAPDGCFGSAVRLHAARGVGHGQRNRRHNRFDRDRSSCRSAPGCDIARKQTAGPARHHRGRIGKHPVDERHVGRDTRLACVPSTMCGTASSVTAKFSIGAVPAFRLKQAFNRCPTNRQPAPTTTASSPNTPPTSVRRRRWPREPHVAKFGRV
jgi:hypothetical protein